MKKSKLLIILAGFLLPSLTFAFDLKELMSSLNFEPAASDLSLKFLINMYGTIAGLKQFVSAPPTIAGTLFGVFNTGLLALGGLFLSYNLIKMVTETSMDGSAMGKSATMWTTIRCSVSVTLLVPLSSGYSVINTIVMWIVVQSIGLADLLWNKTLDYVVNNGSVIGTFLSNGSNELGVNYYLLSEAAAGLARETKSNEVMSDQWAKKENVANSSTVLKSLVCAYAVQEAIEFRRQALFNAAKTKNDYNAMKELGTSITTRGTFDLYHKDELNGKYVFPYINKNLLPSALLAHIPSDLKCGSYTYKDTSDSAENTRLRERALTNMIESLTPIAKAVVDKAASYSMDGNTDPYRTYIEGMTNALNQFLKDASNNIKNVKEVAEYPAGSFQLVSSAIDYQLTTSPIWKSLAISKNQKDKFDTLRKDGWLYAGAYYQDLHTKATSALADAKKMYCTSSNTTFPLESDLNKIAGSAYESRIGAMLPFVEVMAKYGVIYSTMYTVSEVGNAGTVGKAVEILQTSLEKFDQDITGLIVGAGVIMAIPLAGPPTVIGAFRDIPLKILHVEVQELVTNASNKLQSSSDTAIEKLIWIGEEMIKAGIDVYEKILSLTISIAIGGFVSEAISIAITGGLAAGTFLGTLQGAVEVMASMSGLNVEGIKLAQTVTFLMLPVVLGIVGPLLICGLVLLIYVPIIPLILFLFGGISWLIGVLVLMIAAPITCFLMLWGASSQDNPLLSKEAEQFVMQLIGVFFRPALMVIGLVVGMILAEVGCQMLNEVFVRIVDMIVGTSAFGYNYDYGGYGWNNVKVLFKVIGVLTVYTFALMSIVNMAFSCIHLLYSEVMRIIGISAPSTGGEQKAMEGIKAGVQQSSESTQRGMEQSATGLKDAKMSMASTQQAVNQLNRDKLGDRKAAYEAKKNASINKEEGDNSKKGKKNKKDDLTSNNANANPPTDDKIKNEESSGQPNELKTDNLSDDAKSINEGKENNKETSPNNTPVVNSNTSSNSLPDSQTTSANPSSSTSSSATNSTAGGNSSTNVNSSSNASSTSTSSTLNDSASANEKLSTNTSPTKEISSSEAPTNLNENEGD